MSKNLEIPKGWEWAKLGDVCEIILGQSPTSDTYNVIKEGLPFFQGKAEFTELYPIPEKWCSKPNKIAEPFDILLSVRAPVGAINIANQQCCIGRGLAAIRYPENYKFICHYLRSIGQILCAKGTGTTFKAISGEIIREQKIPLPPLPEQHRIVAKIEALFSSLEKGIESLKTAQQQLKVYRQSVLKWAFDGKLTNDNIKDGELPDGWKWVKLGDVSEMCLGKMLDKKKNKGSYQPYLRNINVRWGAFDLSALEEMRFEENEEERYRLKKGDLIICEGGEPGRCAVWNYASQNMKIQKALHRVRVIKSLSENFVFHYMLYSTTNGLLEKYFTGTTIKHLTGRELKKIQFPLPPLPEQQAIVSEIESRLSVCDKLEESVTYSLKQAEALRQSILKKAFEGKLVPQDPNDEPASALLERIKAEKEKNQPEKKVKMKKAKS